MVPEVEHIEMAIRLWEEECAGDGWDVNPRLMVGLKIPGETAYGFIATPVQPAAVHPHTPTALETVAELLESDLAGEVLEAGDPLRHDRFIGYFVMYESWMNDIPEAERDSRNLADIPGSVEVRNVMGVDTGGRLYYLSRTRGQDAKIEVFTAESKDGVHGDMVQSLIRLVKATTRFAPADSRNLPALNALFRWTRQRSVE